MRSRLWRAALDRHVLGALALLVLLCGAYSWSIGLRATRAASITGDEPFYLLTTQSIIDDLNLDLREQYRRESYRAFFDHPDALWRQSIPLEDGRLLSPHEPGLSAYLVPGFALDGLRGAQMQLLLTAAATFALAFVLAALETRAPRLAWLTTAAVALAAPAFVYATEVYPELPAAFCIVLSLLVLRRPSLGVAHALVLVLLVSLLAWLGAKYVPLGCLLGLALLWRGSPAARTAFLAAAVASSAAYAWLHLALFGSLTPYSANTVYEGAPTLEVVRAHLEFGDRGYRLWGLFVDRRFGIARWAPLLLPVLPALLLLRGSRVEVLVAALIVTQLLIGTFVAVTMMGWWFPGRTLVAVLPLAPLVLTRLVLRVPLAARLALAAGGAYSLLVTAALARAARAAEVTLAVDPFAMSSRLFAAPARLFPDYTRWSLETNVLTAAWLTAALLVAALLIRLESGGASPPCPWLRLRRPQLPEA